MTNVEREALDFLRDFEVSSRTYFMHKGLANSELPTAILEAQWQLLHYILQSKMTSRQINVRTRQRGKRLH